MVDEAAAYLGVAAFGYALLHTVLCLVDEGAIALRGSEISKSYIWAGWLVFLIFVPLDVTSTADCVCSMDPKWKNLQHFVYGATVLTLFHWETVHDWSDVTPALIKFGPFVAFE